MTTGRYDIGNRMRAWVAHAPLAESSVRVGFIERGNGRACAEWRYTAKDGLAIVWWASACRVSEKARGEARIALESILTRTIPAEWR
jgi:hypothetical protein